MQTIAQLFDLTGKSAVVTGGAMGIGQAIGFRLAEAHVSVMITDIDLEAASQTVKEIKSRGGKAQAMRADAQNTANAKEVAQAAVEAFGRLDILVNSAGIYPFAPALDVSEEVWDKVLDINLKGVFFYSQAAAREMVKAGHGGKIINIASIDALHPGEGLAHYDASKAGVVMLTKALALEFAPHNILVNAIAPGGIETPGFRAAMAGRAARSKSSEDRMKKYFTAHLPLQRMGKPDDVAKVVLFLASAAADYMTGSLLVVDAGLLLS
jgi:2-deoxy-D-gluconate 3-dehydrogenase